MQSFRASIRKALVYGSCISVTAIALRFLRYSFIVGSQFGWFSPSSMLIPLTGAFGGLGGAIVSLVVRVLAFRFIDSFALSFTSIVPGFCAAVYWATHNPLIKIGLPCICVLAFLLHPVGCVAGAYVIYWFIPIIFYLIRYNTLWANALSTTFVGHAVGSVIWLYTKPAMTSSVWLGLIPVVLIERLITASGIVLSYYCVRCITYVVRSIFLKNSYLIRNTSVE